MIKPSPAIDNAILLKKLCFRSWHRGCKETDLILGPFSDHHLESLSPEDLALYEVLLDEADADIWDWCTHKKPAPEVYRALLSRIVTT